MESRRSVEPGSGGLATGLQVADVIAGSEGLGGVRWLLRGPEPQAALRSILTEMLERPGLLASCRLVRAKYRAGHKLTAGFEACISDPRTGERRARPVGVTWWRRDHTDPPTGAVEAVLEDEARRRGVAAPFSVLDAREPAWDVRVQVAPLDDRFPQLVRLSDPAYAQQLLGGQYQPPRVDCIRYRPHQRHVLRYAAAGHDQGPTGYVKLYPSEAAAQRAYQDIGRISEWVAAEDAGFTSMGPLACFADDAAVLYGEAHGSPVSSLVTRLDPRLPQVLEAAGAALRILQAAPVAFVGGSEQRDFAAQLSATGRSGEHRSGLLPGADDSLRRLLDRARHIEERMPRVPDVFSHGDFKPDHVYVNDAPPTIIDLDNRCLCDPGYDAGKFLADLHWLLSGRGAGCIEAAQARFLEGYDPDPERLLRARLWEAVMLAYQGFRRMLISDGQETAGPEYRLSLAHAALDRVERRLGVG